MTEPISLSIFAGCSLFCIVSSVFWQLNAFNKELPRRWRLADLALMLIVLGGIFFQNAELFWFCAVGPAFRVSMRSEHRVDADAEFWLAQRLLYFVNTRLRPGRVPWEASLLSVGFTHVLSLFLIPLLSYVVITTYELNSP